MSGSSRKQRACTWFLTGLLSISFAFLTYPLYVIRPFRYQGPKELSLALDLLQARPWVQSFSVVLALAGLAWCWQVQQHRRRRIGALTATLFVCLFAALSWVNPEELIFQPIARPEFASVKESKVDNDDEVIAIKIGDAARAYPVRSIAYHHVVNDVLGQVPIVATY